MDEPLKQGSPIERSIGTGRDEPGKEKSKAWEQAKKEMEGEGRAGGNDEARKE